LQAAGQLEWSLPEGYSLRQEGGAQEELFVGGVYVRLFLKNPQYPLRCAGWAGFVFPLSS
jgi:DnaJ family protein C protein 13